MVIAILLSTLNSQLLIRALGRAAKAPGFQPGEAGSTPAGHSWGSVNGKPPAFEAGNEGSSPSPQTGEPELSMGVV